MPVTVRTSQAPRTSLPLTEGRRPKGRPPVGGGLKPRRGSETSCFQQDANSECPVNDRYPDNEDLMTSSAARATSRPMRIRLLVAGVPLAAVAAAAWAMTEVARVIRHDPVGTVYDPYNATGPR